MTFFADVDQNTLLSWTQKHPEHWTPSEVLDWIYFIADTLQIDATTLRGEAFQNIGGPQLCGMTLEDFVRRDPQNGQCFHDMFMSIRKDGEHELFPFCLQHSANYVI